MPYKAPKACEYRGCINTTLSGRFCKEHKQKRVYSKDKRPSAAKRGYGARWKEIRSRMLRVYPLCNCGSKATEVHHVQRYIVGTNHEDYDLVCLCKSCHSRITGQNR